MDFIFILMYYVILKSALCSNIAENCQNLAKNRYFNQTGSGAPFLKRRKRYPNEFIILIQCFSGQFEVVFHFRMCAKPKYSWKLWLKWNRKWCATFRRPLPPSSVILENFGCQNRIQRGILVKNRCEDGYFVKKRHILGRLICLYYYHCVSSIVSFDAVYHWPLYKGTDHGKGG